MRVQLQRHVKGKDFTYTFYGARANPNGVTKQQMREALAGIYAQAAAPNSGFPARLLPLLKSAVIDSSQQYTTAGPFYGPKKTVVQSTFRDPQNQGTEYRLDTDNLSGVNFLR
jgi:hypothetical protein